MTAADGALIGRNAAGSEPRVVVRAGAWIRASWVEIVVGLVAIAPFVAALVRAVTHHYVPVGDDALIALRIRDVLTAHHPLLGTGSSASITLGVDVNHPGPAMFDVLAPFARAFGTGTGIAVGVTLTNLACLIGAAVMAHRVAGRRGYVLLLLMGSVLAWSMGSEYLFDVWQPNQLVFPFLLLLVLSWAVGTGRVWALPWAFGVGSVIVQTHVSYIYLVPIAILTGVFLAVLADRARARRLVAPVGVGIVVGFAVWAQPLWQNFLGPGPPNLGRLLDAARGSDGRIVAIGYADALRYAASVWVMPPWILRPSYGRKLVFGPIPPMGLAATLLAVLAAALVLGAMTARGDERRPERGAAVLALVAAVTAVVALARQPVSGFVFPAAHQMRWLWAIAAFMGFALLLRVTLDRRVGRAVVVVASALIVLISVLNLPAYSEPRLDGGATAARPAVRELRTHIDRLRGRGTLLYDATTEGFGSPYGAALLQAMGEDGIGFVVRDRFLRLQVGPRRADHGCRSRCDVRSEVSVHTGADAWNVPSGSERVIFVRGISTREVARLAALEGTLSAAGVRIAADGSMATVPTRLRARAVEYGELRRRRDLGSVAVVVRPLP